MRKRSHLLELAILGLLTDQDLHGYEIKRRLTDVLGIFSSVSFGSMYPALARLESEGAVKAITAFRSDGDSAGGGRIRSLTIPLTGSLGGERAALRAMGTAEVRTETRRGERGKKVFAITDLGTKHFQEFLASPDPTSEDDATFKLRLSFARHLNPDSRLGMLEQRRAYLIGRLAKERRSAGSGDDLDPYARSIIDHSTSATENDITWLESLIQTERSRIP